MTTPSGSEERRTTSAPGALWTFVALLALAAVVAFALLVATAHAAQFGPWFLALLALFGLSEVFVVHFEFRRSSHTFSLVELPLVLGLLYASPTELVPAHLLGAGVALYAHRRQRAVKLVFNLASLAAQDCVAIAVYRMLSDGPVSARSTWFGVIVACTVASLVGIGLVLAAMALSGDLPPRSERQYATAFGLVATLMTTCTAMAMALLAELDTLAAFLLGLPVVGIYLAHRAYVATRVERRHVEVLRDSAQLLVPPASPIAALDHAIVDVLAYVRTAFGVELAALAYRDADPSVRWLRTAPGVEIAAASHDASADGWDDFVALVPDGGARILGAPRRDSRATSAVAGVAVRDGMAVALHDDAQLVGYLLVANRLSDVGRFSGNDLRVLQAVGRHVVAVLAGTAGEDSMRELRVLDAEARYRTRHDHVTGLANIDGLRERLTSQVADAGPTGVAALLLDVSSLDTAADAVGTDGADRIVLVVGQRLRNCVREDDLVARIGGGRFAVAARTPGGTTDAHLLATRLQAAVGTPMNVDGVHVALQVAIGGSLGAAGADADHILLGAELALVMATSAGPGSIEILTPE